MTSGASAASARRVYPATSQGRYPATSAPTRPAIRSADGEKYVKATCASGLAARTAPMIACAINPSPTDGACTHTNGRVRSRDDAAHASNAATAPRRPATPRLSFAWNGAARRNTGRAPRTAAW